MLNLRYESGLYCLIVSLLCLCASAQDVGSSARVASVKVATAAPSVTNRALTIWYRVPAGYSAQQAVPSRILVIFGGRNASGKEEVSGKLGWDRWADAQNAFLVSPGYYNDDYWEPRAWSGKALLDGIDLIRKRYLVCDRKLLYYGYSAGSQCANLFAAWRPDFARGWVAHGCGVFHEPKLTLRQVPVWRSPSSLWNAVLAVNPASSIAHSNLGQGGSAEHRRCGHEQPAAASGAGKWAVGRG